MLYDATHSFSFLLSHMFTLFPFHKKEIKKYISKSNKKITFQKAIKKHLKMNKSCGTLDLQCHSYAFASNLWSSYSEKI